MPADQQAVACPYCLCANCYETLAGCAIDGCPSMVEVKKAAIPHTHWGATTKVCPMCAETIPVDARQCAFCRASFSELRPMTREDYLPKMEDPALADIRKRAKWLLAFSVIGFTSPVALIFGGFWYRDNKAEIERAGAGTRALVVISLLICVLYIVMVGGGALVFALRSQPS
jgi:hypothetical protein